MSDIAIKIEGLGKRYRYGGVAKSSGNLRADLAEWGRGLFRPRKNLKPETGNRSPVAPSTQVSGFKTQLSAPSSLKAIHEAHLDADPAYFWALKDINLEVNRGEVVGIIGRNGAGKSTLLKILSRITPPTTGTLTYNGRMASLLEVGTGFHRELTGRENIFLNGSILGMRRAEITKKFDEIVAFAEVEKFIDTPVKFYSSGMYVRLAFAVAAHLEPEILIVDEVLAVGDAAFQKKCLGKMGDVAKQGRTILFVSHNMAAISALCSKAMVLKNGEAELAPGNVDKAVQRYLMQVQKLVTTAIATRRDRTGVGKVRITDFAVFDQAGNQREFVASGEAVEFRIYYKCAKDECLRNVTAGISISSHTAGLVTMLSNQIASEPFTELKPSGYLSCLIGKLPLGPGNYILNLSVSQNEITQDWIQEAATLTVEGGNFFGTGKAQPLSHSGALFEQTWSSSDHLFIERNTG